MAARDDLNTSTPVDTSASIATVTFTWPELKVNQALDGGRSWTAMFDSYDQSRENVYYLVRLFQGEIWIDEFMVEIGTEWTGDDWTVPTFLPELTRRIAQVAATGRTNTAYSR